MDWTEFWRSGKFTLWFMLTLLSASLLWPFTLHYLGGASQGNEADFEYVWGVSGLFLLVGAPFIIAAFVEIMLVAIAPAAIGWRMTLPLVLRLRLPAWLAAATSGLIAVGFALLTIYLLITLTWDTEWLRWLLIPLQMALMLGGPAAAIFGPILAALLLREPFRKHIDTIRG